jgi:CheY-like chemotaxis protein
MKAHSNPARILVASDSVDDATQIVHQLKVDFAEIRASTDSEAAVADFESFKPDVLVLAFDRLQKAQEYAVGLYRFTKSHHVHRTLLLCVREEVRSAFELCKKGTFDDYVLYWPHAQDGLRLTMSVWNAARQNLAQAAPGPSHLELVTHIRQLGAVNALLDQQMTEGEGDPIAGSLQQAEGAVGAAIDELHQRLIGDRAGGIVDVKDRAAFSRAFEQLKTKPVADVFKGAATALAPAGAWTRQLKEKLAPHMSILRALGDKVRAIKPLVLFVEDDDIARKLTQKVLEGKNYELVFAHDGTAALGLLRDIRPDLILMDVNLPDIDGVTLTRKLKTVPRLAEIPVLMLTGDARQQTVENSMSAGAAGFIVKPYTREALIEKIDRFLSTTA